MARSVAYLGHTFTVPAGGQLADLAAIQSAMLVEPSSTATTASAPDDAVDQRITATLRGVGITASYGAGRCSVVTLLSAAGVPRAPRR